MKRLLAGLLVCGMLTINAVPAFAYKGIEDVSKTYWAQPEIASVVSDSVMSLSNGNFYPENKISRVEFVKEFVQPLVSAGIVVSLFIDADKEQVEAAAKTGAQFIELHTGRYSEDFGTDKEEESFQALKGAAAFALTLGLKVNAGHGLNYENVKRMHEIPDLVELNIGHSIIARAVFVGLPQAVREMKELVEGK